MEVINLTLNLITDISANAFTFVLPKTVHSLNRQVCCMSGPWQKCKLVNNAFGNCKDLLSNKVIRGIYWFTGIVTLTTNLISIFFHLTLFSQLQTNKLFTLSLSMVDCLYGLYLLTISMTDWYYRGYYEGAKCMWRKSFICKTFSFSTLVSLTLSPILLFTMVLSRFCVIRWPMTSKFKSGLFGKRICLTLTAAILCFCFIITTPFIFDPKNPAPTGLCILLHAHGQLKFIAFLSLVIISVQMFCLISNVIFNLLTILELIRRENSNTFLGWTNGKYKEIIIHLFIVIFVNICSWVPSIVVFILPLTGYQMPTNILTWTAVTAVPIHFAFNPVLFLILTPTFKRLFSTVWTKLKNHID